MRVGEIGRARRASGRSETHQLCRRARGALTVSFKDRIEHSGLRAMERSRRVRVRVAAVLSRARARMRDDARR